jgi:hypothetical protein
MAYNETKAIQNQNVLYAKNIAFTEKGSQTAKDVSYYIQLCLNFNPLTKKSKNKK